MSTMEYRNLGRTGLKASVIGLGGEWMNGKSRQVVREIFDTAIAAGVNVLDVFMPQPETRSHIGFGLRGRREAMLIQGHLCTVFRDGQYERTRDLELVRRSFDDLLARLETDYIDIGMIHYVDDDADWERVVNDGVMAYAQQLRAQGVIRHIGLSSHHPAVALRAVESGLIDVLMFSINAAYDLEKADTDIYALMEYKDLAADGWTVDPVRQRLYLSCERLGVGITVMKALGAGTLLRAETSPFGRALSVTRCCHYCLTRPGVVSVLVGCANAGELEQALAYIHASAPERDYAGVLGGAAAIQASGKCMYCNHCQPCPAHLDIAAITRFLDLAAIQEQVPETVLQHYRALDRTAVDCLMCGRCEPNCPFGVKIRDNMKRARALFGENK